MKQVYDFFVKIVRNAQKGTNFVYSCLLAAFIFTVLAAMPARELNATVSSEPGSIDTVTTTTYPTAAHAAVHLDSLADLQAKKEFSLMKSAISSYLDSLLTVPKEWVYRRNPGKLKAEHFSFARDNLVNADRVELIQELESMGFRLPQPYPSLGDLKRAYLLFVYEEIYFTMNELTGLPQSVIFSYHMIESINQYGETKKHRLGFNLGGIKATKGQRSEKFFDDCYEVVNGKKVPVKCNFAVYDSPQKGIAAWAAVFNSPRYQAVKNLHRRGKKPLTDLVPCKSKGSLEEICKCLYDRGYHTSPNWMARADLARKYWEYRSWLPR